MVVSSDAYGGLVRAKETAAPQSQHRVAQVAKEYKLHPLKQLVHILSLRFGRQRLSANEYYDLRLFEPKHIASTRRGFLGHQGVRALNQTINPESLGKAKETLTNTSAYEALLNAHDIATSQTQAFATSGENSDATLVLRSEKDLITFLTETARYPLFGKPKRGAAGHSAMWIERCRGDQLILGNGRKLAMSIFASDIFRLHSDGYLLQSALLPHADLRTAAGPAMSAVRLVTTHDGLSIAPLYAVWKLPAPRAMFAKVGQAGSMLALLCTESGEVLRCYRGTGLAREELHSHPSTGAPLIGRAMPYWSDLINQAKRAHALTPELGLCGFDIAITQSGPVILDGHAHPDHMLYQFAANEGICAEKFSDLWARVKNRRV